MTWGNIILLILQVANALAGYARERNLLSSGEDAAIAKAGTEVLRKTDAGKKIMERVDEMGDSMLDDLLRSLEPPK